jgi:hypothetical protein
MVSNGFGHARRTCAPRPSRTSDVANVRPAAALRRLDHHRERCSAPLLLAAALLANCGNKPPPAAETASAPARTATERSEMTPLLVDLAAGSACDQIEGSFLEIEEPDAPEGPERGLAAKIGRLWAKECRSDRAGEALTLRISGKGWSWVSNRKEQLGAAYEVAEYLPFRFRFTLVSTIDYDYARDAHLLTVWVTPLRDIDAAVTPLREPRVDQRGAWSHLLGGISTAFTFESIGHRAKDEARVQGGAKLATRLAHGATVTVDLCTGQVDRLMTQLENGTLPQRPYPSKGHRWEANSRVTLRRGGLDADGPWRSPTGPFRVEIDVERGDSVRAGLYCEDDAARAVEAFLDARTAPALEPLASASGKDLKLTVAEPSCPIVLVTSIAEGGEGEATFRYVAFAENQAAEPVAPCD